MIILAALAMLPAGCVPTSEVAESNDYAGKFQFCVVTGFPMTHSIARINADNALFLKILSGRIADQAVHQKASLEDTQGCDVMASLPQLVDAPLRLEVFSAHSKRSLYWSDFQGSALFDRWASAVESLYRSFRPGSDLYKQAFAERAKD